MYSRAKKLDQARKTIKPLIKNLFSTNQCGLQLR